MQAGGQRFDPVSLHQTGSGWKRLLRKGRGFPGGSLEGFRQFFKNLEGMNCFKRREFLMRESPVTVWNMGCDCIHEICKFLQETEARFKRTATRYRLLEARAGKRRQGYRIKRPSACGGCLGDHRRRRTRQSAKSPGELTTSFDPGISE